jgi:hypothetical protein
VYRSKLLLDSDLAARSAALARVYGELGFQSLALVEGWRSLNTDPANFSAHRLLADSYAALPRHEIARVNELFQSQMLQPINIAPIQPRLGEGNLFLISAQGPSSVSTNEFTPLFNRNRVALQANGLFGEDETYSGEGIVSAIYDRASFSGGFTYADTDGFRPNNDLKNMLGTAFTQYEISPQTSVQAEYRYRDRDNGDVELRFFEDSFSRFRNEDVESHTARGGVRHEFSPHHTVLASYIYANKDSKLDDSSMFTTTTFPPGVDRAETDVEVDAMIDLTDKAHSGEAQYLFRSGPLDWLNGVIESVNVTSGVGYADVDAHAEETSDVTTQTTIFFNPIPVDPGPPPIFFTPPPNVGSPVVQPTVFSETHPDIEHTNVYLYSYISLPYGIDLTLGASGDFLDVDNPLGSENQGNPKVGVTWNPPWVPGMTVRGAVFRTLRREPVVGQTLEPTQVAGFNQFFDDIKGTDAWRYGGAVDQKFSDSLFGGAEFSKRELEVPIVAEDSVFRPDWDEYLSRLYLFWTPCDWVSLRAEYQWEKFEREQIPTLPPFAFREVETHRVPFGIQFFHPIGVSASFGATYLHQDGQFDAAAGLQPASLVPGHRDFWLFDTSLRYRLPKRYGFVTFGVNNLADEDATYQATDFNNPDLRPGRFIYGSVTLAFP